MADLTEIERSSYVRITNKDEDNSASVTNDSELLTTNVTIKENNSAVASSSTLIAGSDGTNQRAIKTDSDGRVYTVGEVLSSFPSFKTFLRKVLAQNAITFSSFIMPTDTAIKELHVGGRVACESILARYFPSDSELFPFGGFNSSGDVSSWTNTGNGSSGLLTWNYVTDQFIEGTGSAKLIFTQSDVNNYPEITYIFPTPIDLSEWKSISASVRTTVAGGPAQTRTVSIRIQSGTAIRIWQIVGTTNTAPFNVEQWQTISGDLDVPNAIAGTGVFDINSIDRISLRLQDSGNKTGSIWWDNILKVSRFEILEKIYSSGGSTEQLVFDPVILFNAGEELYISVRNNGATTNEVQASTSGVEV